MGKLYIVEYQNSFFTMVEILIPIYTNELRCVFTNPYSNVSTGLNINKTQARFEGPIEYPQGTLNIYEIL